jgi:zinc transporter
MSADSDHSATSSVNVDGTGEAKSYGIVPALVWAFRIHDDGSAEPLPIDQAIDDRRDGWLWLHVNLADARVTQWLRDLDLPPVAIAVLLARDKRQQLHTSEHCIYGVFADLTRQLGGSTDQLTQLRFVMTERLLISGRHHAANAVEKARRVLEQGERRLPHVAALLELIVEHAADGIERLTDDLADELDEIESNLSQTITPREREQIGRTRRTGVKIHRQLGGLRALFHRLEHVSPEDLRPGLRLATGRLAQYLDSLDHDIVEIRDRAQGLQAEVTFAVAEETNRHLHFLSVVTALFLPATLVTGVFGMNVKGIPFLESDMGFGWTVLLMVGSVLGIYFVLRWVGVFKS